MRFHISLSIFCQIPKIINFVALTRALCNKLRSFSFVFDFSILIKITEKSRKEEDMPFHKERKKERSLERMAFAITIWAKHWFPDTYIFAIFAVIFVSIGAWLIGAPINSIATSFGEGYWSLIPFTMQMAMIVISGYVAASSKPALKLIRWLANLPKTESSAVAYVAFFTIIASLFNWALSLVFGGLYVRALARRKDLRVDYRAAGAAAYLGLGATWALGLSSSAALLQANADSIPKALLPITGVISFYDTIFLPQSFIMLYILLMLSVIIAYLSAPDGDRTVTAQDLGINVEESPEQNDFKPKSPGEKLERSPLLTLFIVLLGVLWILNEFKNKNFILAISNLNTYNFLFLILGMLLCWRPYVFIQLVNKAVPSVASILIQFPLYGSIAYILTKATSENGQSLSNHISHFFVSISTQNTFSALMGIYSAVLGFFIPSGGGKWIIEAPYVMQAANELKVHLGWTVMVYNASEALPNLINPFFMIALVGVLGLKARDIVGYTITQLIFHAPIVILMLWLLGLTLTYQAPVIP